MRNAIRKSIVLAILAVSSASVAEPAKPKPPAAAKSDGASKVPAIEPQALAALDRMGAFLRRQQSFSVRVTTQTDYVLENGQKIQLESRGDLKVRRPDHLRAEVIGDHKHRQFFYDGKQFTMFSPQVGFYTTLAAPPTIKDLADLLQTRYGLELPLVDLFRWGSERTDHTQITAARYIGPTRIDGVAVDQYAFRQPGLDWQIWIERGNAPVPRKLVLTTTDDPARPEHALELSWKLDAKHNDQEFAFKAPKDATRIAIADLESLRAKATKERRATRSVRR